MKIKFLEADQRLCNDYSMIDSSLITDARHITYNGHSYQALGVCEKSYRFHSRLYFAIRSFFHLISSFQLTEKVKEDWKKFCSGKKMIQVYQALPVTLQTITSPSSSIMQEPRGVFDPKKHLFYAFGAELQRNLCMPEEIENRLLPANYYCTFHPGARIDIDEDDFEMCMEKFDKHLPICIIAYRFGNEARPIKGPIKIEDQEYPVLNLKFISTGILSGDGNPEAIDEVNKILAYD